MEGFKEVNLNDFERKREAQEYKKKWEEEMRAWVKKTGGKYEIWYDTESRLEALKKKKITERDLKRLVIPALTHPHPIIRKTASTLMQERGYAVDSAPHTSKQTQSERNRASSHKDAELSEASHEVDLILGDEATLIREFEKLEKAQKEQGGDGDLKKQAA